MENSTLFWIFLNPSLSPLCNAWNVGEHAMAGVMRQETAPAPAPAPAGLRPPSTHLRGITEVDNVNLTFEFP